MRVSVFALLVVSVGAVVTSVATVASGALHLSVTSLVSGAPFVIDQSDPSNAGYPVWLDLTGAAPGWSNFYSCPLGPCDAATYAILRAKPASTGAYSVSYVPSAFQSGSVPFGVVADPSTGALVFSRSAQPSYWAYALSMGILAAVLSLNLYAISRV